jgi:transcription elongation factor Elf1
MPGIPREMTIRVLYERLQVAKEAEEGARLITCDRCPQALVPFPPGYGVQRRKEHPRTRWILPLSTPFATRSVKNVTVLCGECMVSFQRAGVFMLIEQYQEWLRTLDEDRAMVKEAGDRMAQMEAELREDAAAAGEQLRMRQDEKTVPITPTVPPEAIEDFDAKGVVDEAEGGEDDQVAGIDSV